MSYCVQCGVKLEKASKTCPLCSTPVVNPNIKEDTLGSIRPVYANEILALDYEDRKYTTALINLILIALNIITFTVNVVFIPQVIFWPIVVGSSVVIGVVLSIPLLFREFNPYLYIFSTYISIIILFALISFSINTSVWMDNLGLPILTTTTILVFLWIFLRRKYNKGLMFVVGQTTVIIGFLCILIEGLIKLNDGKNFLNLSWSIIVLICGVTIAAILVVISMNKRWREEVRKRFHL